MKRRMIFGFFLLLFLFLASCKQPLPQKTYSVAFVILTLKNVPATTADLYAIRQLKEQFREAFTQATGTKATLNASYAVVELNADVDLYNDPVKASTIFYQNKPDAFDFIVFFSTEGKPHSFVLVKNTIEGIGLPLLDATATFGSKGRLQGIIMAGNWYQKLEKDTEYALYKQFHELLHLLGHRWCCYVGKTAAEGELGILEDTRTHWADGLESPTEEPMGARVIEENNDGTFTYKSNCGAVQPIAYHPFTQYFMGLVKPEELKESYRVWHSEEEGLSCNRPLKGEVYFNVNVYDLIKEAGERKEIPSEELTASSPSNEYLIISS